MFRITAPIDALVAKQSRTRHHARGAPRCRMRLHHKVRAAIKAGASPDVSVCFSLHIRLMWRSIARHLKLGGARTRPRLIHHVDFLTRRQVIGWAFDCRHGRPLTIEAWVNDACVGRAVADEARSDVAAANGQAAGSLHCGFHLPLQLPEGPESFVELRVCARDGAAAGTDCTEMQSVTVPTLSSLRSARDMAKDDAPADKLSPFPRQVIAILERLWPEIAQGLNSDDGQGAAVERIVFLASFDEGEMLPCFVDYLRFLGMTKAHFEFVAKFFPKRDANAPSEAKDAGCTPNSIEEMLSVAHHLYVLKSYGVEGSFAEFGCFKGFSTALLSYACDYLNVPMLVFDSFEGLPASESSYYKKGDFRGSLEEVRRNVKMFGVLRAVSLKKGYFSQTVSAEAVPDLMCLWMDVDLAASSKDIMVIAHKIHPRGCIFSHECAEQNFVDGDVVATTGPDSVLPPILEALSDPKLPPLTGRFIAGATGSLWRSQFGVPVLANSALLRLVRSG